MRKILIGPALFILGLPAQADLLKCKDTNGKITYSERKESGMVCTPVTTEITIVPALPVSQSAPPAAVNPLLVQREALQNKIKEQEAVLAEAKKQLTEQEGIRLLKETFYQNVLDRLKPFQDKVAEAEKSLAQTRAELNNLK